MAFLPGTPATPFAFFLPHHVLSASGDLTPRFGPPKPTVCASRLICLGLNILYSFPFSLLLTSSPTLSPCYLSPQVPSGADLREYLLENIPGGTDLH